ncbi:MAG: LamG domain-containing protein [Kofleriaceae bacterium]|nr:LamG domain-containing protein [Kofleriaceae bacterium]
MLDTAVDARAIDAATDAGSAVRVAGAQVQWKFNEGAGQFAADSAGLMPAYDLGRASLINSEWSNGGLTFTAKSYAKSAGGLVRPITACQTSKSATLEAWFVPSNAVQGIPTRPVIIAGLSVDIGRRNFEISQVAQHLVARTRTEAPSAPDLQASNVVAAGTLLHVVLVQEQATQRLYVNGVEKDSQVSSLLDWESTAMYVGSDMGLNASWVGTVRAVVLYCSALTATQVQGNFAFGPTL